MSSRKSINLISYMNYSDSKIIESNAVWIGFLRKKKKIKIIKNQYIVFILILKKLNLITDLYDLLRLDE